MNVEVTKEHQWLQGLLGDWTFETECSMGPDQPPSKFGGRECVRSLGDVWVLGEGKGDMPGGGQGITLMTLGFDPAQARFVGSFIGSMMTHMWIYNGTLVGNVLTLDTEGPSFAGDGKTKKYQDLIEFLSPDHRTLSSQTMDESGQWVRFMTAHYHRIKG